MSKKLMVLSVFFSVLLASCAQKSTPEKIVVADPSVSPFKVLNVCFNEEKSRPSRVKGVAKFAEVIAPDTKIFLLYKIPLTLEGEKLAAKLDVEFAYQGTDKRGVHRQLTGEPYAKRVSEKIYAMAKGDNGVYGWDCGDLSLQKSKEYMPEVKFYFLADSKAIKETIHTQGLTYKLATYVVMGDLYKEGQEINTNLLTVSNHQGYLPEDWSSCDSEKENCMAFKASWEVDKENAGKTRLALKQVKADGLK